MKTFCRDEQWKSVWIATKSREQWSIKCKQPLMTEHSNKREKPKLFYRKNRNRLTLTVKRATMCVCVLLKCHHIRRWNVRECSPSSHIWFMQIKTKAELNANGMYWSMASTQIFSFIHLFTTIAICISNVLVLSNYFVWIYKDLYKKNQFFFDFHGSISVIRAPFCSIHCIFL